MQVMRNVFVVVYLLIMYVMNVNDVNVMLLVVIFIEEPLSITLRPVVMPHPQEPRRAWRRAWCYCMCSPLVGG